MADALQSETRRGRGAKQKPAFRPLPTWAKSLLCWASFAPLDPLSCAYGAGNSPPIEAGCVKNSRFPTNNPQQTKDLRGFRAHVRARAGQDDVRFTNLGRSLFTPSRFTQEFA
jgi:hypothetical protein